MSEGHILKLGDLRGSQVDLQTKPDISTYILESEMKSLLGRRLRRDVRENQWATLADFDSLIPSTD